jgi:hypothetical protein
MTTASDIELKETLLRYAEEVGEPAAGLAGDVLRGGRRRHRRRTVSTALAGVAVLATAALVIPTAARHVNPGASATTTLVLRVADDRPAVERVLLRRFAGDGLAVSNTVTTDPGQLTFVFKGTIPAARLSPLLNPDVFEIRKVLGTYQPIPARAPVPGDGVDGTPTLQQVRAKLGSAYALAAGITRPGAVSATTEAALAPFARLSPAEVSVLPTAMQFNVPAISCAQLDGRPADVTPDARIVVCDASADEPTKYLLDAATVTNADVRGASTSLDDGLWEVDVSFTRTGQSAWTDLTRQLYDAYQNNGGFRQVALVLDGIVIVAPNIDGVIDGPAVIGSADDNERALSVALAAQINNGPLAAEVPILSISHIR